MSKYSKREFLDTSAIHLNNYICDYRKMGLKSCNIGWLNMIKRQMCNLNSLLILCFFAQAVFWLNWLVGLLKWFFGANSKDIVTPIVIKREFYLLIWYYPSYYVCIVIVHSVLSHTITNLMSIVWGQQKQGFAFSIFLIHTSILLTYLSRLEKGIKNWFSKT